VMSTTLGNSKMTSSISLNSCAVRGSTARLRSVDTQAAVDWPFDLQAAVVKTRCQVFFFWRQSFRPPQQFGTDRQAVGAVSTCGASQVF
jgi:hypothetical protein